MRRRERREERSWKKLFLPEARSGSPPGATEQLFSGGTAQIIIDAHPRNPSLTMGVSVSSIVAGPASSYLKSRPLSNKIAFQHRMHFTQIFPVDIAAETERGNIMPRSLVQSQMARLPRNLLGTCIYPIYVLSFVVREFGCAQLTRGRQTDSWLCIIFYSRLARASSYLTYNKVRYSTVDSQGLLYNTRSPDSYFPYLSLL